ncbi:AtzH-like domain-containing protein [Blastococcus saxobsidens]|uniref:Asp-tRNA(Asn)/Glu-tRNA(Gln) amidotransferase A subunit family amidase n=1 Tax=Blastococcus saxobsidens TaxID=138336 RepID=A0A4Q7Y6T4_9ACTN|nr:AtzH-like domain-containing protein [Blastococcus saxobsidens]RZU31821.1 Asp-tRNA(Asn)/Glu-tRNA(Gln) amidotransferase A subunit family amidase [Blastococcus saxobsidens]
MSTPPPPGLLDAFGAYESALLADDVSTLDLLSAPGDGTVRADAEGVLVGHEAIAAVRAARGGAPLRTVVRRHVQVIDAEHALVVAETEPAGGGRGVQTQLWQRFPGESEHGGWKVTAEHVSEPPPAIDARIWRIVGEPLVPPTADGPLTGQTVAVKDLYAVAGHPIGAGNPAWLVGARPEPAHAAVVARLLAAGASLRGIARTDELAYSLGGTNPHYGTPPNPGAPHRIPGGSSSGSASAVALGQATIGLGTDTAGSIRVPAAYQGLYGIRTTHDLVDRTGLVPLAPDFDAVGWLARSAEVLQAVGGVLLPPGSPGGSDELVFVPELVGLADADVEDAVLAWMSARGATSLHAPIGDLEEWREAFQTWQAYQAWESHGGWLRGDLDVLGVDVRSRFAHGATISPDDAERARQVVRRAGARLRDLVGHRVLVLPSAPSVAAPVATGLSLEGRTATVRLTCLAALAGLPAVGIPASTAEGLPVGVCLLAAPGRDRDLLALAAGTVRP